MTARPPTKPRRSGDLAIIPAAAVFDEHLGLADLRLLCALGAFADRHGKCWPATTTLAKELRISDRRVRECLRRLEGCGYVQTEHRPGQRSVYLVVRKPVDPGRQGSGVDPNPGRLASAPPEGRVPGTPEGSLPPNVVTNVTKNDYAFSGAIVHLTWQGFSAWQEAYKAIPDLRAALQQRDDWLAKLPESDRRRKDWFVPTSNWLANQNKQVRVEPAYDPDVIH